jgi:hypothetical protein
MAFIDVPSVGIEQWHSVIGQHPAHFLPVSGPIDRR